MVSEEDREHDAPQQEAEEAGQKRPRSPDRIFGRFVQTVRPIQPVKFKRFTALRSSDRRPSIIYTFELPPGETELDPAVYAVLKHHQRTSHIGGGHTGLKYERDQTHGKCWTLPSDEFGRAVADRLDIDLLNIAAKMERDGRGR